MYFNNMKYISRFLFMQAFFPFFVEEKLIIHSLISRQPNVTNGCSINIVVGVV